MKTVRVIPRIDIKGPNLVKGIHLEGLRVLGNPGDYAKYYYQNGADEIMFMDVVASLYDRNSIHDIILESSKNIFIPITVGGGLRTIDDIKEILRVGADKVCLNTAAVKNPDFIKKASRKFGSSTIVIAIEAIKTEENKYLAFTDNGREFTGLDVYDWAKKVEKLGAGEIVLTSVDQEGTRNGMDIELIKNVSELVNIPVIAHGGIGNKSDAVNCFIKSKPDAIMLSSLLHYSIFDEINSKSSNEEGNIDFITKRMINYNFSKCKINDLKSELIKNKIQCRL